MGSFLVVISIPPWHNFFRFSANAERSVFATKMGSKMWLISSHFELIECAISRPYYCGNIRPLCPAAEKKKNGSKIIWSRTSMRTHRSTICVHRTLCGTTRPRHFDPVCLFLLQTWSRIFTDMFLYLFTPLSVPFAGSWRLWPRLMDFFFSFRVACIWSRGACLPAVQSRLWLAQLWENFELSK